MDAIYKVQITRHNRTTFFTQIFITMDVGIGNVTFEALSVENENLNFFKKNQNLYA
jgi:phage terminase large subunit-like protein